MSLFHLRIKRVSLLEIERLDMNYKNEGEGKRIWVPIGAIVDVVHPEKERVCYACLKKPIKLLSLAYLFYTTGKASEKRRINRKIHLKSADVVKKIIFRHLSVHRNNRFMNILSKDR